LRVIASPEILGVLRLFSLRPSLTSYIGCAIQRSLHPIVFRRLAAWSGRQSRFRCDSLLLSRCWNFLRRSFLPVLLLPKEQTAADPGD
jgi:hypothetical protein